MPLASASRSCCRQLAVRASAKPPFRQHANGHESAHGCVVLSTSEPRYTPAFRLYRGLGSPRAWCSGGGKVGSRATNTGAGGAGSWGTGTAATSRGDAPECCLGLFTAKAGVASSSSPSSSSSDSSSASRLAGARLAGPSMQQAFVKTTAAKRQGELRTHVRRFREANAKNTLFLDTIFGDQTGVFPVHDSYVVLYRRGKLLLTGFSRKRYDCQ